MPPWVSRKNFFTLPGWGIYGGGTAPGLASAFSSMSISVSSLGMSKSTVIFTSASMKSSGFPILAITASTFARVMMQEPPSLISVRSSDMRPSMSAISSRKSSRWLKACSSVLR